MLTLYYSYWQPGGSLYYDVRAIKGVPPDATVNYLRALIARATHTDEGKLHLYQIPENSPVSLKDMKTTKISFADLGEPLSIADSLAAVFGSRPAAKHLHLVVANVGFPFVVRCWIRGRGSDIPIMVEVPRLQRVLGLLGIILDKTTDLAGIPAGKMELYKFSYNRQENCDRIIQGVELGHLLPKVDTLETVFNDIPINEDINVVVDVIGWRDKRIPDWDPVDRAGKRPKVVPSDFGVAEYYATQASADTRFLDHRTVMNPRIQNESPSDQPSIPDEHLAPFEVLYAGFGEFLEAHEAGCQERSTRLRLEVDMFAEAMAKIYDSEKSRQSAGLKHLDEIFFPGRSSGLTPAPISGCTTDGHYVYGRYKIPCLFVEFRNEDVDSKAIPAIQLASYYNLSVGAVKEECKELIRHSRLPALGMTIVGPIVTFYAIAWVGSVAFFRLTSGTCVSSRIDRKDRLALRGAFIAAIDLFARIEKDAEKLSDVRSRPPLILSHFYPDITELPSFLESQGSVKFHITKELHNGLGRILYRARSIPPDLELVIKFTHSYSIDLHDFCASLGHAPTIRGFKRFPGGVVAIAMDYVEGVHLGPEGSQEFRDEVAKQLKQLVKEFHLAGYVHGDLRLPNIYHVRDKDKIMLLDFDWGGKVGEAFYPSQTLNSVLRERRDMDDLMITKEDDERVLRSSLESIGCS